MKLHAHIFIVAIASAPLLISVLIEFKIFMLWPQVTVIWETDVDPLKLFTDYNPHALRFLVVYPIFKLSEIIQVDYNTIFSIIMIFAFYLNIINVVNIINEHLSLQIRNLDLLLLVIVFEILYFLMNGRGGIAFFGFSLILRFLLTKEEGDTISGLGFILIIFGFILCSVSSGSMFIALIVIFTSIIADFRLNIRNIVLLSAFLYTIYISLGVIVLIFLKNIHFYGEGLEGLLAMLNHGFGKYILVAGGRIHYIDVLAMAFLILIILLFIALIYFEFHRRNLGFLYRASIISLAMGVFGYTALALSIIPLSALLVASVRNNVQRH